MFILSSANTFNLEQSKKLSFGKALQIKLSYNEIINLLNLKEFAEDKFYVPSLITKGQNLALNNIESNFADNKINVIHDDFFLLYCRKHCGKR